MARPRRPWADSPSDGPSARLGKDFLRDLACDYRAHGAAAIADVRKNESRNYLRLLLSLVPDRPQDEKAGLEGLTDAELEGLLRLVRAELARKDSVGQT